MLSLVTVLFVIESRVDAETVWCWQGISVSEGARTLCDVFVTPQYGFHIGITEDSVQFYSFQSFRSGGFSVVGHDVTSNGDTLFAEVFVTSPGPVLVFPAFVSLDYAVPTKRNGESTISAKWYLDGALQDTVIAPIPVPEPAGLALAILGFLFVASASRARTAVQITKRR